MHSRIMRTLEKVRAIVLALIFASFLQCGTALLESRDEAKFTLPERGKILLFDFRPDSAASWKIAKGVLYLFLESGAVPQKLNISTVTAEWTQKDFSKASNAVFGKAGSKHQACVVTELKEGWMQVDLPVEFLQAHVMGKSFGFAIEQGPRKINGRRPVFKQPYIFVDGE